CTLFIVILLFSFTSTAPSEIFTLSLHDALPILASLSRPGIRRDAACCWSAARVDARPAWVRPSRWIKLRQLPVWQTRFMKRTSRDRKSTRLNSSHVKISYAVFCLKKKKKNTEEK